MTQIKQIFIDWKDGEVHGRTWFEQKHVSLRSILKQCQEGFLVKIGPSAFMKKGDELTWQALVRFIQVELKIPVHVSGRSALELQGVSHYLAMGKLTPTLLSYEIKRLPSWVFSVSNAFELKFNKSNIFGAENHLVEITENNARIWASCRELAILELITELDLKNGLETVENYMNSLMTLRPAVLQQILVESESVLAKRVFLYVAEKLHMPFLKELDLSQINLGTGKRVVVEGGKLDKKYLITVDRTEEENPF